MRSPPHSSFTFTLGDLRPGWGIVKGVGGERGVVRGGEGGLGGNGVGKGIDGNESVGDATG